MVLRENGILVKVEISGYSLQNTLEKSDHFNVDGLIVSHVSSRDGKSHKRHKHRWCSKINTGVNILVSWDLFFGACHFCSLKTANLANVLV